MLCGECHDKIQDVPESNLALLDFNRELFGAEKVDGHIEAMRLAGIRVNIYD